MTLKARILKLETTGRQGATCPEHLPDATADWTADYMDGLRWFSPDPSERAAAEADADALEATPPCPSCGWRPFVIRVQAGDGYAWTRSTDDEPPGAA